MGRAASIVLLAAWLAAAGACTDAGGDAAPDAGGAAVADGTLGFPAGFRWGVATSAFQTEGHVENDYTDWIPTASTPAYREACDSWNRWQEDVGLAAGLGARVFRMSVEWARIEPEEGRFDDAALAHYRDVVRAVRDAGMEPLVTLHHFTNPRWVAAAGGWADPGIADRFSRYAGEVAARLGDLVDDWNPQNESMVYVVGLGLVNAYPGGALNDLTRLRRTYRAAVFANAAAADAIRERDGVDADGDGRPTTVWLVHAMSPTFPADPADQASVAAAARWDRFYNRSWVDALVRGALDLDFDGRTDGAPDGLAEGVFAELAGRVDVIGVNYYNRVFVVPAPGLVPNVDAIPCLRGMQCGAPSPEAGDNGNEVYPPGLYQALAEMAPYGLPLAVSENGVADRDDDLRPAYLVRHVAQVHRAIEDGMDVRAYLHWSLLDNYEWADGYTMKFGLFAVDFTTQARTPRGSADLYRRVIQGNGLAPDMPGME
ncbi:MAG: glycoside hydrolase family 1 protein [Deltaproteobacteria bacterium]|nr:glycoside hydrolase family 1 protein [Deltaproteobacteria bacterium]